MPVSALNVLSKAKAIFYPTAAPASDRDASPNNRLCSTVAWTPQHFGLAAKAASQSVRMRASPRCKSEQQALQQRCTDTSTFWAPGKGGIALGADASEPAIIEIVQYRHLGRGQILPEGLAKRKAKRKPKGKPRGKPKGKPGPGPGARGLDRGPGA